MTTRVETLDATESILEKAGFQISERCTVRPSCFDVAARRKEQLTLIKVPTNVGSIHAKCASALQMISNYFQAAPLFIGEKSREKPLEDDTVYSRYNMYAINLKTLKDITCREIYPLVEAGPGGYYVKLEGITIRKRRQKVGLSIGKLAEMVGISRRTMYGYENDMAKASVSSTYKLEWILGIPLVQPIDIFQTEPQSKSFFAAAKRMIVRNRFLKAIMRKFAYFNLDAAPTERTPFDFIAQFPEEHVNIIGGVTDRKEQNFDRRAEEITSVSKIFEAQPVFITEGQKLQNDDIPLICYEELMKIRHSEEFINLL
jgi:putative transcriptional regulator